MGFENNTGTNARNFYGPRTQFEGVTGEAPSAGMVKERVVTFTGKNVNEASDTFFATLPKGAKLFKAVVDTNEVFVLGGTTPEIFVGTQGSESTNNVALTEASMETTEVTESTDFSGTWAAEIQEETVISVAVGGGGSNTISDAGVARVTLFYYFSSTDV
jgi:hypothetical protein